MILLDFVGAEARNPLSAKGNVVVLLLLLVMLVSVREGMAVGCCGATWEKVSAATLSCEEWAPSDSYMSVGAMAVGEVGMVVSLLGISNMGIAVEGLPSNEGMPTSGTGGRGFSIIALVVAVLVCC
jgi:hypothetical protein